MLRPEMAMTWNLTWGSALAASNREHLTNEEWPARTQTSPGVRNSNDITGLDCRSIRLDFIAQLVASFTP